MIVYARANLIIDYQETYRRSNIVLHGKVVATIHSRGLIHARRTVARVSWELFVSAHYGTPRPRVQRKNLLARLRLLIRPRLKRILGS